jgi:hypothetical protein
LLPPDTVGDVGPNHYIQLVNNVFSIFDKQGNLLAGPSPINSLWTGFGGPCETKNSGDPIVQYDHLADRWIISQFTLPGANHQCFAVSRTGDPITGGWFLYDFTLPAGNDYPKISVWPDAYYMSSQRGFPGGGLDVYAFDRNNMLVGNAASFIRFFVPAPSLVLLPSDLDGPVPPSGTPNFFTRQVDGDIWGGVDRVEIFAFTANWASPASSSFTALPSMATVPFDSQLCSGGLMDRCIPQPGTAQTLETLAVWPMYRLQYRNFGTHETLVFNHTVDADGTGHAGIRWYELRRPPAGTWSIFQQGTFAPDQGAPGLADDVHRWMGSIAMDGLGNIALCYSVASATVFPSLRFTGRLANDPLGVMTLPEVTIVAGGGSQTHSSGRWGDYSTLSLDPVDGCKFWFTSEYYPVTSVAGWRTRIASFTLDTQPPAIHCPNGVVQNTTLGTCSAIVNYAVTVSDNCAGVVLACNPPANSVFPKGATTVNCTATDNSGNVSSCSFGVTVLDNESPTITCPPDQTVEFTSVSGTTVSFSPPTATDNCPGVAAACVPLSGSSFPIGINQVLCQATDASGNTASCAFKITVLGPFAVKQNVLADLKALRASVTNKKDKKELDDAIEELAESLDPSLWKDDTHLNRKHGERAIKEEKDSVQELVELLKSKKSSISNAALQNLIDRIVKSDRALVQISITDAVASSGNPGEIRDAKRELAKADLDISRGDYESGFEHFRHAWQESIEAIK